MSVTVFVYLAISTDGTSHEFHHRMTPSEITRDVLRGRLHGRLERIPIAGNSFHVWCDESGYPKGLPPNPLGSHLVSHLGGGDSTLVGTLLLTGRGPTGTITSLSDAQIAFALELLETLR